MLSRMQFHSKVFLHSGFAKDKLHLELESFGMVKASLPKFVNNNWGYKIFVQWQEAYGIYTLLCFLLHNLHHFPFSSLTPCPIMIYCDNNGVIECINEFFLLHYTIQDNYPTNASHNSYRHSP